MARLIGDTVNGQSFKKEQTVLGIEITKRLWIYFKTKLSL